MRCCFLFLWMVATGFTQSKIEFLSPIDSLGNKQNIQSQAINHFTWDYTARSNTTLCIAPFEMVDSVHLSVQDAQQNPLLSFQQSHTDIRFAEYQNLFERHCFPVYQGEKYSIFGNFKISYANEIQLILVDKSFANFHYAFHFSWMIFYFGCILGFILINLFIAFYVKNKVQLYYVCFLVFYLITSIISCNLDHVLFGKLGTFEAQLFPLFTALTSFFLVLFSMEFLQIRANFPKYRFWILSPWIFQVFVGLVQAFGFLSWIHLGLDSFVLSLIFSITLGIVAIYKKQPFAKLYTFSWFLCLLGFLIYLVNQTYPLVNDHYYIDVFAPTLTHILEMFSFSITLSLQYHQARKNRISKIHQLRQEQSKVFTNIRQQFPTLIEAIPEDLPGLEPLEEKVWKDSLWNLKKNAQKIITFAELEDIQSIEPQHFQSFSKFLEQKQHEFNLIYPQLKIFTNLTWDVLVHQYHLEILLEQLLDNAKKFGKGNPITLTFSLLEHHLLIRVQDQGPGFANLILQHTPGQMIQLDSSLQRDHQGFGIGLALSYRITQIHQGIFEISNHLGALINCSLGVKITDDPWRFAEFKSSADFILHPKSEPSKFEIYEEQWILVVDDNPINRKMTCRMLDKMGIPNQEAKNGEEALTHINDSHCVCILMDLQMPVMDGLTATKEFRKMELLSSKSSPIVIIAITAHDHEGTKEECLEAGMQDILSKPFSQDDLRQKLHLYLSPETMNFFADNTL